MTTSTPIRKQIYRFRLIAFKKNDHDIYLNIPANSILEAWAEAKRRSFGFPYYLQTIQKPHKKQPSSRAASQT